MRILDGVHPLKRGWRQEACSPEGDTPNIGITFSGTVLRRKASAPLLL